MHLSPDVLVEALRREGFRITGPRRAICAILAEAHDDHLTPSAIRDQAAAAGRAVDLSTVYRTLDTLEQAGLVEHVHLLEGTTAVHLTDRARHHHLVCQRCGRSADIPLADVEDQLSELAERHGFEVATLHFALSGVCRECAGSV